MKESFVLHICNHYPCGYTTQYGSSACDGCCHSEARTTQPESKKTEALDTERRSELK